MVVFWIILAVILGLFLAFTEELYRYVFCRNSSKLFIKLFDTQGHAPEYYTYRQAGEAKMRAAEQKVFTIPAADGNLLKGFYYPCGGNGKKIAFVVHGYRSDHTDTGGICYDYYKSRGIDVFCCDHRGEGESQGKFIGFDVFETEDCLLWIDFLKKTFGSEVQILLHGFSMGAATVMRMSSRCPENVKFIIEDSGYADAYASMHHQVFFMYQPLRWLNKWIAGYDWNDSDVTRSLDKSRLPMLFVHGQEDRLVPYENGPKLYERYAGDKDCFFPEKTRHIESMYTNPEEYGKKIDAFLEKYFI